MLTMETLDRTKFIGGSEVASILGLSRYGTPLGVWARKTGNIEHADLSDVLPVEVGKMLEDTVAKLFEKRTGKEVFEATADMFPDRKVVETIDEEGIKHLTIFHPEYPFIAVTPDRILLPHERSGLECKTTNSYKQKDWEASDNDIPVECYFQCLQALAVTGFDRWYAACLIGNREFVWRVIERDEKLIDDLIRKEVSFWKKFVEPKVMPAVMANDSSLLYKLFPIAAVESVIELDDEANKLIESLDSMTADQNQLEADIEKTKNELKAMLKTFEKGRTNRYEISWKNQFKKLLDSKLMKQEEPALYERFAKESITRQFRYKVLR